MVIERIVMKCGRIIIPVSVQEKTLDQLHLIHMGIEKTKLLAHKSIYWININTYIEKQLKITPNVLIFRQYNQI